jgi:hypothetical protein
MDGNEEFVLLDEQKLTYEKVISKYILTDRANVQYITTNQAFREILRSLKVSVFFVDDLQKVAKKDIGTLETI